MGVTDEGVTEALFCCADAVGAAIVDFDVRRVSFVLCSAFSDGAMLLLDLFVNLDTCGALLLVFMPLSLSPDLVDVLVEVLFD